MLVLVLVLVLVPVPVPVPVLVLVLVLMPVLFPVPILGQNTFEDFCVFLDLGQNCTNINDLERKRIRETTHPQNRFLGARAGARAHARAQAHARALARARAHAMLGQNTF